MLTNFPTNFSNLNPHILSKPFTINLKTLSNVVESLAISTRRRIIILFQPCTTYKWIDNHYMLSIVVTSSTITTLKLAKASVALVASNNTLCMPQPKEF
jgi:hypothetical protein